MGDRRRPVDPIVTPRYLAATGMPVAWRSTGMTSFAMSAIERCQSALRRRKRDGCAAKEHQGESAGYGGADAEGTDEARGCEGRADQARAHRQQSEARLDRGQAEAPRRLRVQIEHHQQG